MAYMCNTANIKEMKNGRPQTVMFERAHNAQGNKLFPNGTIVELGDTLEGKQIGGAVATAYGRDYDHVHKVEPFQGSNPLVGVDTAAGKWIVVAPEINIEEYRLIDGQISKFSLEENVTYTAYQLQKLDRIEYTEDYFDNAGQINVGDFVKFKQDSEKLEKGTNAGDSAFRVVAKTPMFYPVILGKNAPIAAPGNPGQQATFLPTSGIKFKLEVIA